MTTALLARTGWMTAVGGGLVAGLLAVAPAAGGPDIGPTAQIKQGVDRAVRILQDPALRAESMQPERRRLLRAAADDLFDFEEMSRRALGPHWRALNDLQRRDFASLFADVLDHAYMSTIERFSGESVVYAGERADGDYVTVYTRILRKDKPEISIDYRMCQRNGRWFSYDVTYEGVSLAANYRTQFSHIIQTSSYDELLKKLRGRIEQLQALR
jgi:phospholipid transport system substrate-binding protein